MLNGQHIELKSIVKRITTNKFMSHISSSDLFSDIATVDENFLLPSVLEGMNNSIPKSRLE